MDEILKVLFSYLPFDPLAYYSKDIVNCSLVNKTWRKVCMEEFSWYPVYRAPFRANALHDEIKSNINAKLLSIEESSRSTNFKIVTDRKEIRTYIEWGFTGSSVKSLNTYFTFLHSDEQTKYKGLWRNLAVLIHSPDAPPSIYIICQINISQLIKLNENGSSISESSFLFQCIDFAENLLNEALFEGNTNLGDQKGQIEQPKGFIEKFLLSSYQLRAVNWLLNIEKSDRKFYYYDHIVQWQTLRGNLYFDKDSSSIVHASKLSSYQKNTFVAKGGILADDKGIGRKVQILGLILATLNNSKNDHSTETSNGSGELVYTHATLVLCDYGDLAKWRKELYELSDPHLIVLAFENIDELENITHQDIVNADVVVVSPMLDAAKAKKQSKSVKSPVTLIQFFWYRVVLADSHMLVQNPPILRRLIPNLHARYWWCVSQSPFITSEITAEMMRVLGFPPGQSTREFITRLVWRTTRKSIEIDCNSTFITENIGLNLEGPELGIELSFGSYAHYTLEETKLALRAAAKKVVDDFLKNMRNPFDALVPALYDYAAVFGPEIYKGLPISLSNYMRCVTDAVLAKQIEEAGDLNDEAKDIYDGTIREEYRKAGTWVINLTSPTPSRESKKGFSFFKAKKKADPKKSRKEDKSNERVDEKEAEEKEKEKNEKGEEFDDEEVALFLKSTFGAKIAHFLVFVKKLWLRDPSARVLFFAEGFAVSRMCKIMDEIGIGYGIIISRAFAASRLPVYTNSTNKYPLRVFLLPVQYVNILGEYISVRFSHVFFLQSTPKDRLKKMLSSIAPQGNRKVVHVIRLFFKDSTEHKLLLQERIVEIPVDKTGLTNKLRIDPKSEVGMKLIKAGCTTDARIRTLLSMNL